MTLHYRKLDAVLSDGNVWSIGGLCKETGESPSRVLRLIGKLEGKGEVEKVAGGYKRAG